MKKDIVVFVGPTCSGKTTISRAIADENHKRINTDALITYMGMGHGIEQDDLIEELEYWVNETDTQIFDIGGSTLSILDEEHQEKVLELFKGARVYFVSPNQNEISALKVIKKLLSAEKNTDYNRKRSLFYGAILDLQSDFLKKFVTEPPIFILKNKKQIIPYGYPLLFRKLLRDRYHLKVVERAKDFAKDFWKEDNVNIEESNLV